LSDIKILGKTKDLRTDTFVLYLQMPIPKYLQLVGDKYDDFEIQRRKQAYKAYERMREDIRKGTLLPSITLAIKPELVAEYIKFVAKDDYNNVIRLLERSDQLRIIDGLQRTHILNQISASHKFAPDHLVLVELWCEDNIYNLIYRIIVLNAGQKQMSLRHQIELLFGTIKNTLEAEIQDLEIFTERDEKRRNQPRKYALERIVTAYQCFMLKDPEINKQSIIAKQLNEQEGILELTEQDLGEQFRTFQQYLGRYADMDTEISRIYTGQIELPSPEDPESLTKLTNGLNWFGSDNVMNSVFAAISNFGNDDIERIQRVDKSITALLDLLHKSEVGDDPLGLLIYQSVVNNIPVRKINVGVATRKLISTVFYEYFRAEGTKDFDELWRKEAP
jgi:hypothetical protein